MATANEVGRSIQVEFAGVVIRTEGPDSFLTQERLVNRLISSLRDSRGRLPMGFESGSALVTEISSEVE